MRSRLCIFRHARRPPGGPASPSARLSPTLYVLLESYTLYIYIYIYSVYDSSKTYRVGESRAEGEAGPPGGRRACLNIHSLLRII